MHYAFVLSLCVVAASPAPPSVDVRMEAAARAYRIESYNRHREDRERYQELRDADDELRLGLSAVKEADLLARQDEATAWYADATRAIHTGDEIPATPAWLPEALADASAGKLRSKTTSLVKATKPAAPTPSALPPTIPAARTEDEVRTPFFFVDAALKAAENFGTDSSNSAVDPQFDVKEPVIDPPGPIVDKAPSVPPVSELPTLETSDEAPKRQDETTEPALSAEEPAAEPTIEPTLELPTLENEAAN